MPASSSTRLLLFVGETLPFRSFSRNVSHGSRFITPVGDRSGRSGPLTLDALGFKAECKEVDGGEVDGFEMLELGSKVRVLKGRQLKDAVFKLEARGLKADELHGDLGKLARSTILKRFKNGELRILVTNELSARGLDVPECDLVVNIDLPIDSTHCAHRAGRTGRLGRKGTVVIICEESELFVVKKMQKQLGVPIPSCEFSEGKFVVADAEEDLPVEASA